MMRLVGLRSLLFWALAVLAAGSVAGCDNPFDPLNTSDEIQGLAFVDFSASQERWDSDPELDGLVFTFNYNNSFGEVLAFHDKPHKIEIEFWSQEETEAASSLNAAGRQTRGNLLLTMVIEMENSDDIVRVPIETYGSAIGLPSEEDILGCLVVRVFPPEESPRRELIAPVQCDQDFYTFEPEL